MKYAQGAGLGSPIYPSCWIKPTIDLKIKNACFESKVRFGINAKRDFMKAANQKKNFAILYHSFMNSKQNFLR